MVEILDPLERDYNNRAMERYVITMLDLWKTLTLDSRMLGVVHAEYVHYHPIDDLHLAINLETEGS